MVTKAGTASPRYLQLMSAELRAIKEPTIIKAEPVAKDGRELRLRFSEDSKQYKGEDHAHEKIGEKKTAMKKAKLAVKIISVSSIA